MSLPLRRQKVRAQEPLWSCNKLVRHSRFGCCYAPRHPRGSYGQHTPMRFYLLDKNISDGSRSPAAGPTRVGWPEPEVWPWSAPSGWTLTWKDWLNQSDHFQESWQHDLRQGHKELRGWNELHTHLFWWMHCSWWEQEILQWRLYQEPGRGTQVHWGLPVSRHLGSTCIRGVQIRQNERFQNSHPDMSLLRI